MISYATISMIKKYAADHYYVLWKDSLGGHTKEKAKNILKILFGNGLVRHYNGSGPSSYFLQNTRRWEYPWVLEQLSGLSRGSKILDCGCGVSSFPLELYHRGYQVAGMDRFLDENYISLLFGRYAGSIYDKFLGKGPNWGIPMKVRKRLKDKVQYVEGLMDHIPLPDNTFDAVTCLSVMEHIVLGTGDDPAYHYKCLDEMKRVLKPGGFLICTYDTVLEDKERFWAGKEGWGERGWHYLNDIDHLNMVFKDPQTKRIDKDEISRDPDAYIIPPEAYYGGYGIHEYERITSVGFVLVKT